MKEKRYMRQALWLAEKGRGKVNPNPLVGAVIVREGKVVGEGYHGYYGGPHAERVALEQAGELAKGATLYVTLEPCCHYGKTPPCTEAILESGIRKVVGERRRGFGWDVERTE
jgi:diaminohydroxyphosphoribosylaminopyrimidine deaminase/5-amino-6-(5-phosphoribosylamino)uracil reductase